jgi:GntR family transcriptional regulator
VRDALVERIANNEWKSDSSIPSETDLAREMGVSAGTMRKALDVLAGEHVITRRPR